MDTGQFNEIVNNSITIGAAGGIIRSFNKKYGLVAALGSVLTGVFFAMYVAEPIAKAFLNENLITPFIACSSLIGYEIFNCIWNWFSEHVDIIMNGLWNKVLGKLFV